MGARIQSQLEEAELKTGKRAQRETLISGAYLTLCGLLLTPEAITEFSRMLAPTPGRGWRSLHSSE
jgi:hypothetical protein